MMRKTRNSLPDKVRSDVSALLNARLADSLDLQHQAKQAHWNVRGPNFIAIHRLFDEVAELAEEASDLMAERILQLGGTAEGTIQVAAERTTLARYPLDLQAGRGHIEAVAVALSSFGARMREAIDSADKSGDKDTADIFTELSRGADKFLWFVESHLE